MLAAQELVRDGYVGKFVITAGSQQAGEQELAGPIFRQIKLNNPRVSVSDVIVSPVSGGTIGELTEYQRLSAGINTSRLALIATETHLGRIKRRLKKKFGEQSNNISVYCVENVLTTNDRKWRYQGLVEKLRNSADELDFKKREKITSIVEMFPFGSQLIDRLSRLQNRWAIWSLIQKALRTK